MSNQSPIPPLRMDSNWFYNDFLKPGAPRKLADGSSASARLQDKRLDREDYKLLKEAYAKSYGSPSLRLDSDLELLTRFNKELADNLDGSPDGKALPEILDAVTRFSTHETAPNAMSFEISKDAAGQHADIRIEPRVEPAPAPIPYEDVVKQLQQQRMKACDITDASLAQNNLCMMDNTERMGYVLKQAGLELGPEMAQQINAMATKENLLIMGGMVGLYALAHGTPLAYPLDGLAIGAGALAVGMEGTHVLYDLSEFIRLTNGAVRKEELDVAGQHLARAMARVGVDTALLWLTRKAADHIPPPSMPRPAQQLVPAGVPVAIEAEAVGRLPFDVGVMMAKSLTAPVDLGPRTVTQSELNRIGSRLSHHGVDPNKFGAPHLVRMLQNPHLNEVQKLRLLDLVDNFTGCLDRGSLAMSESLKGLLGKVDAMGQFPATPRPDKVNEIEAALLELDRVVELAGRNDLAPGTKVYHEPKQGQTLSGLPPISDPQMTPDAYFMTRDGVIHMEEMGLNPKTINGKLQSSQADRYATWVQDTQTSQKRQFSYIVGNSSPRFDELISQSAINNLRQLVNDRSARIIKIGKEWFSFSQIEALSSKCESLWSSQLSSLGQNRSTYFGTLDQARQTLKQYHVE